MNSSIAHPEVGQGPRRGAYIVGNYEVVGGIEVDGLRSRLNMRTSQNSAEARFAEFIFHALRCIRASGRTEATPCSSSSRGGKG
jgi:hypothetical protein